MPPCTSLLSQPYSVKFEYFCALVPNRCDSPLDAVTVRPVWSNAAAAFNVACIATHFRYFAISIDATLRAALSTVSQSFTQLTVVAGPPMRPAVKVMFSPRFGIVPPPATYTSAEWISCCPIVSSPLYGPVAQVYI